MTARVVSGEIHSDEVETAELSNARGRKRRVAIVALADGALKITDAGFQFS